MCHLPLICELNSTRINEAINDEFIDRLHNVSTDCMLTHLKYAVNYVEASQHLIDRVSQHAYDSINRLSSKHIVELYSTISEAKFGTFDPFLINTLTERLQSRLEGLGLAEVITIFNSCVNYQKTKKKIRKLNILRDSADRRITEFATAGKIEDLMSVRAFELATKYASSKITGLADYFNVFLEHALAAYETYDYSIEDLDRVLSVCASYPNLGFDKTLVAVF